MAALRMSFATVGRVMCSIRLSTNYGVSALVIRRSKVCFV